MQTWFRQSAKSVLGEGVAIAASRHRVDQDYRAALCRFEDALFAHYPNGHRIIGEAEAGALLATVFKACGRRVPKLDLVAGFDDPRIGGFADVEGNRIMIEQGCLYRFLVLHEAAHLLVPADHRHGPVFTYVLQVLYRIFIGIPEHAVRDLLVRFGLPSYTDLPGGQTIAAAA
jgi:hypothetical protein